MTPAELAALIRAGTGLIELATRLYAESQAGSRELTPEEMAEIGRRRRDAEGAYERMLAGEQKGGS
jgi:hypothetical protein